MLPTQPSVPFARTTSVHAFVAPTLRKLREGWGTHLLALSAKSKAGPSAVRGSHPPSWRGRRSQRPGHPPSAKETASEVRRTGQAFARKKALGDLRVLIDVDLPPLVVVLGDVYPWDRF